MHQRRTIVLLLAAVFVLASCGAEAEEPAAAPEFLHSDAATWAGIEPDGFNYLVIDLTSFLPPPPRVAPESMGPGPTTTQVPVEATAPEPSEDPTTLLPIGSDESVHIYSESDGSLWAVLDSGEHVPVALGSDGLVFANRPDEAEPGPGATAVEPTTTTTEPTPPPPYEPSIVVDLRADPAIASIVALGDGTWSVHTSLTGAELESRTGQPVTTDAVLAVTSDDRYYADQWSLENLGADGTPDADIDYEGAQSQGSGDGVVVAVIDSGVDFSHPELLPSRWENTDETSCSNGLDDDGNGFADDCHGWDFVNGDPSGYDHDAPWHGTHLAGIIGATVDNQTGIAGIAPGVEIMDLRVVGEATTGASTVAAAIRYAVDNGADVVNLSLSTEPGAVAAAEVGELARALDHALAHDVLVVAAAGNDATDIDDRAVWPASFEHPNLVTVAASTWFDSRAPFSNTGDIAVDLFAPGAGILSTSTRGRYHVADGTSAAAAHVSATAALVRAVAPDLDAVEIRERILSTVDTGSGFARAAVTEGRLNAARAVKGGDGPVVTVEITGFDHPAADREIAGTITAHVGDPALFAGYELGWAATLATRVEDRTYVLVDHPVTTAAGPGTSGDDGRIDLSAPAPATTAPVDLPLSTELPTGEYALIVETTVGGEPDLVVGSPRVFLFTVGDPADSAATEPTRAETPIDPKPEEPPAATLPVENGEWRIDSVSPPVGSVDGGGHVTITGSFPEPAFVWIGDTPVNVLAVSTQQLIAEIPRRPEPGPADISLRTSSAGIVLMAERVFLFLAEDDEAGPPTADPTTNPNEDGGGDGAESGAPGGRAREAYAVGPARTIGPLELVLVGTGDESWLEGIWAD